MDGRRKPNHSLGTVARPRHSSASASRSCSGSCHSCRRCCWCCCGIQRRFEAERDCCQARCSHQSVQDVNPLLLFDSSADCCCSKLSAPSDAATESTETMRGFPFVITSVMSYTKQGYKREPCTRFTPDLSRMACEGRAGAEAGRKEMEREEREEEWKWPRRSGHPTANQSWTQTQHAKKKGKDIRKQSRAEGEPKERDKREAERTRARQRTEVWMWGQWMNPKSWRRERECLRSSGAARESWRGAGSGAHSSPQAD